MAAPDSFDERRIGAPCVEDEEIALTQAQKTVALIAHDNKKDEMIGLAARLQDTLRQVLTPVSDAAPQNVVKASY